MIDANLDFKYVPLSFISTQEEFKRQVTNTVIMKYVLDTFNNPKVLVNHLMDTRYGFTDSAKDEGTHKFLRISDIKDGTVDWDSVPFCVCKNETNYLLEENDVLIARTGGTTGKSFVIDKVKCPTVYASYLIRLRAATDMNPQFLSLFLNSYVYWNQIVELKQGSAQPNVNAEKLKGLILPYCDIEIQEKLVRSVTTNSYDASLSKLVEKIKYIENKIDSLEELKTLFKKQENLNHSLRQSILQEAVQGGLLPQEPNDEPGCVLLERIKVQKEQLIKDKKIKREKTLLQITEDEIPYELPQNWVWARLGDVCSIITDGTHYTPNYVSEGIPFLSVKDISKGIINFSNTKFISIEEHEVLTKRCKPEFEDVLLTKIGTTGIAKVIDTNREFSIFVSVLY